MDSLTDAKFDGLRAQGFTGSISDMTLQWLQANGATSDNITDAWREMLTSKILDKPQAYQRNDWWFQVLGELGYSQGQLNSRALAFWQDGGIISP